MRRIGKELTEIECLTGLASDQPPLLNGIMQRITVSPKKVVLGPWSCALICRDESVWSLSLPVVRWADHTDFL
jgi:hypothetical protein